MEAIELHVGFYKHLLLRDVLLGPEREVTHVSPHIPKLEMVGFMHRELSNDHKRRGMAGIVCGSSQDNEHQNIT